MVQRCFRHQHPECYGRREAAEAAVPVTLRYGMERTPTPSRECLPESDEGVPNAVRLGQLAGEEA